MQAAQDAAEIPLLVREHTDRVVHGVDAGVEDGVQVEAAADDDPEQVKAHRAEVAQRVVLAAEGCIERLFNAQENALGAVAQCCVEVHVAGPLKR